MRKKIGIGLAAIGALFIINAIFGRYIVLPGYFESLGQGASASSLPTDVPILKVLRYLLWAFSFKFGMYFIVLGFLLIGTWKTSERWAFGIIGITYISMAYMELPFSQSLFFGLGGGAITLSGILMFWGINGARRPETEWGILRVLGYFFLIMAAYNLCPFCGVKCFALQPEKMIEYGLQATAQSFANHIMIELAAGFACLAAFYFRNRVKKTER